MPEIVEEFFRTDLLLEYTVMYIIVKGIEAVHTLHTTAPIVTGNHFAVGRLMDLTVQPHGRVEIYEIMLYEVKDGKIICEQFFY